MTPIQSYFTERNMKTNSEGFLALYRQSYHLLRGKIIFDLQKNGSDFFAVIRYFEFIKNTSLQCVFKIVCALILTRRQCLSVCISFLSLYIYTQHTGSASPLNSTKRICIHLHSFLSGSLNCHQLNEQAPICDPCPRPVCVTGLCHLFLQ